MKYSIPFLIVLMGADVLLTLFALERGASEANPLILPEYMIVAKFIAIACIVAGCYALRTWRPAIWWPRAACALMLAVVINNLVVISSLFQTGG